MFVDTFLSNEYKVNECGIILGKNGKPLKPSINHRGYQIVNLMIDGQRKGVAVHTLVARAFCPGYQIGLTVNHKDGNKINNNKNNLEWITNFENVQHAIRILGKNNIGSNNANSKDVYGYDKNTHELKLYFHSLTDAAKYLKPNAEYKDIRMASKCISAVIHGRKKSYRGYIWKLYDDNYSMFA